MSIINKIYEINNKIVSTIMSNSGLTKSLNKIGVEEIKTKVGDKFVYEAMQANDLSLGGETSGHIIIKKYATTGDGILTALVLAEEICDTKTSLYNLSKDVEIFPQHLINIKVQNKENVLNDEIVKSEILQVEKLIGNNGKVVVRASGTEPVIRIMVECKNLENCKKYAEKLQKLIKNRGFCE